MTDTAPPTRQTPTPHAITPGRRRDRQGPGLRHETSIRRDVRTPPNTAAATFHFCCAGCRAKFEADPARYLRTATTGGAGRARRRDLHLPDAPARCARSAPAPVRSAAWRSSRCSVVGASGPNPELADMTRRFWIGLASRSPVFVARNGRASVRLASPRRAGRSCAWIEFALATPAMLVGRLAVLRARLALAGHPQPQHVHADRDGHRRRLGSTASSRRRAGPVPGRLPRAPDGGVAVYFEAAAVDHGAGRCSARCWSCAPASGPPGRSARCSTSRPRPRGGSTPTASEAGGRARPGRRRRPPARAARREGAGRRRGARRPLGARRIDGDRRVDAGGQGRPGDKVIGGTLNQSGALVMRADKVGARHDARPHRRRWWREAQRSRAPIQRLADQVAGWFVPAVIGVALVAFAAWAMFGPEPRLAYGLVAAVSVLIIACPCALGLATPMSIMVGVGRGAGVGVLIRNAEALERFERVDTLVVDKTGTLTEGRPSVTASCRPRARRRTRCCGSRRASSAAASIRWPGPWSRRPSEGPRGAGRGGTSTRRPARASRGVVDGRRVVLGGARVPGRAGGRRRRARRNGGRMRGDGATVDFRGRRRPAGRRPRHRRPDQGRRRPPALAALRAEGVRVVMLTGDNRATRRGRRAALGIDEVEAEVLPERKGAVVAAAASARAASSPWPATASTTRRRWPPPMSASPWGSGTDVAIESAGVTLRQGRPRWASCARGGFRGRRCATSARTWSSPSSTMPPACRSPRASSIPRSDILLSPGRGGRRDGAVFGQRDRQRAAAALPRPVRPPLPA